MRLPDDPPFLDFTVLKGAPPAALREALERAGDALTPESLDAITGLLLDRCLDLLRRGSRQDILEESLVVNRFLAGSAGRALKQGQPEIFGNWAAVGDLLSEAARRTDAAAVDSILLSSKGRGRSILELLAGAGRSVARSQIKHRLGLAESQLSHLLRDLEEADLILRYRPEGSREVLVELGPAGRQLARRSLLPEWVEQTVMILTAIAEQGTVMNAGDLSEELMARGASALVADKLSKALAAVAAPSRPPVPRPDVLVAAGDRFNRELGQEDPYFQSLSKESCSPRSLFGGARPPGLRSPPHSGSEP